MTRAAAALAALTDLALDETREKLAAAVAVVVLADLTSEVYVTVA